jgi:hypothetical protein
MTMTTETKVTTQLYRVYIKATPRRSGTRSRNPSGRRSTATAYAPSTICVRAARIGDSRTRVCGRWAPQT